MTVLVKAISDVIFKRDGSPDRVVHEGAEFELSATEADELAGVGAVMIISFTPDDAAAEISGPSEQSPKVPPGAVKKAR